MFYKNVFGYELNLIKACLVIGIYDIVTTVILVVLEIDFFTEREFTSDAQCLFMFILSELFSCDLSGSNRSREHSMFSRCDFSIYIAYSWCHAGELMKK